MLVAYSTCNSQKRTTLYRKWQQLYARQTTQILLTPLIQLGSVPPPLEEEVDEEDELASEGSVSMANEEKGKGGANAGCAIYRRIPSRGASRSKKRLKIETVKGHQKNMYSRIYAWPMKYMESRHGHNAIASHGP